MSKPLVQGQGCEVVSFRNDLSTCKGIKSVILFDNPPENPHGQQNIIQMSEQIDGQGVVANAGQVKKVHWGNVTPLFVDKHTHVPLLSTTKNFIKPYLLNIIIIFLVCLGLPLGLGSFFSTASCHQSHNSSEISSSSMNVVTSPELCVREEKRYLDIYCWAWVVFQFIFLTAVTFSNPGYSQPIQSDQRNCDNLCQVCKCPVDNLVFHCDICDLCCEGFSHHCLWVGKCIGYRNKILLRAYVFGYPFGVMGSICLQLWLSH